MLWVKALHLIFMVTWFAGLFYLPRLFVYHAMATDDISKHRFVIMERKLFFGITTPGGVLTLLFGFWMLYDYAWALYSKQGWIHWKLLLIVLLVFYHLMCFKYLNDFKFDRNKHGHVFYRWFNEFPVLILVVVTFLAVLRPF